MRFFARRFLSISFGILFLAYPFASFAQANVSVSEGYSSILQQGIIFANICVDEETGAQQLAPEDGIGDPCQCRAQGICSLAQVTQIAINIIILILGISGSVALCMFVYGGFNWVFAQGRSDYIQTGKDTMKHAIIGLAIIFGAYALINLLIALIGGISPQATIEDTIQGIEASQEDKGTVHINTDGLDTN